VLNWQEEITKEYTDNDKNVAPSLGLVANMPTQAIQVI